MQILHKLRITEDWTSNQDVFLQFNDAEVLQDKKKVTAMITEELILHKGTVQIKGRHNLDRNVNIIEDLDGNKIVVIHDIRFKGKRSIDWDDVEAYLKQYIEEFFEVIETGDVIFIGKDLPDEFAGSKDTSLLRGTLAKAKANASQGLPELIQIGTKKRFKENLHSKHSINAKFGWYRYDSRFALPVFDSSGEVERYNVFYVELLIRHDKNGKLYLYDVVNIKKETSTPPSCSE